VGVEPTIRPAKGRIAGFEGRGSHRTPFASTKSITGEETETRCTGPVTASTCLFIVDEELQKRCSYRDHAGVASTAERCVRIRAATKSYRAGLVQTS